MKIVSIVFELQFLKNTGLCESSTFHNHLTFCLLNKKFISRCGEYKKKKKKKDTNQQTAKKYNKNKNKKTTAHFLLIEKSKFQRSFDGGKSLE